MYLYTAVFVLFGFASLETQSVPLSSYSGQVPIFRCDYTYIIDLESWFKVHNKPVTWHQAQAVCKSEGSTVLYPATGIILDTAISLMRQISVTKIHTGNVMHYKQSNKVVNSPKELNSITLNELGLMERTELDDLLPFICHKKKVESVILNECGTMDVDYHLNNKTDSCYKFHKTHSTWYDAMASCEAEGGQLAIINSQMEAEVIIDIFKNNTHDQIPGDLWADVAFIGFRSLDNGRTWTTIEDESLQKAGYAVFSPGEPNNATGDEFCGSVATNGKLLDDPCWRQMPFICEKKKAEILCDEDNTSIVKQESDVYIEWKGKEASPHMVL